MGTDDIRERIRKRIKATGVNVSEVERRAELQPKFLHDFLSARKNSLKGDTLQKIAVVLGTTEIWLMRGIEPEEAGFGSKSPKAVDFDGSSFKMIGRAVAASRAREASVIFTRLDIANGSCTYIEGESGEPQRASVVDPAVRLPNNAYAQSLLWQTPLVVKIKELTLDTGARIAFILDALSPER